MELNETDHLSEMGLQIDNEVRQQFITAGTWAKFLSVLMFICGGILLLAGIFGGSEIINQYSKLRPLSGLSEYQGGAIVAIVIFVVMVLIVVYYFLFNFSGKIKTALQNENVADLNTGLKSLKIYFILTTVFAILSLLFTLYSLF
jgi:flagellar biosynthesis protein FlhB